MKERKPNWEVEEVILALSLYFELDSKEIKRREKTEKIENLCNFLHGLPFHKGRKKRIRNANGINIKFRKFKSIDPRYDYTQEKPTELDILLFNEFYNNRNSLIDVCELIKSISQDVGLIKKIEGDIDTDEYSEVEGRVIHKLHRYHERNTKLVKEKKRKYLRENGKLDCEVCGFDFHRFYGEMGEGFIECHHIKPLSLRITEMETRLDDLALVCSNCHRMIHKSKFNPIPINELKRIVADFATTVRHEATINTVKPLKKSS